MSYETLAVDVEDFEEIGAAFEKSHSVAVSKSVNATVRLMYQKKLVDFAVNWIETSRGRK